MMFDAFCFVLPAQGSRPGATAERDSLEKESCSKDDACPAHEMSSRHSGGRLRSQS